MSLLHAGLFGTGDASAILGDRAIVASWILVESALARAQADVGLIPRDRGQRLAQALCEITVEVETVAVGVSQSAVGVPALLAALRDRLPDDLAQFLHWGATSQDIIDTGLMLRLGQVLSLTEERTRQALEALAALAEHHRHTAMVARTWGQQAVPTRFGLVCAQWMGPLIRSLEALPALKQRCLAVQLGGAAGTLSAMADKGPAVGDALARHLGLTPAPPWHGSRDRIVEIAHWCAQLSLALGRIGVDLAVLTSTEVAEVRLAQTGGSSTMPQKQNPVQPGVLAAQGRLAPAQAAAVAQSALWSLERDGAAWLSEWQALAPLVAGTAGAAQVAASVLPGLKPDAARMAATLALSGGAILAEALSFALAEAGWSRADAQALVKTVAAQRPADLAQAVREALPAGKPIPLVWPTPESAAGLAVDTLIDRAVQDARGILSPAPFGDQATGGAP